MTTVMLWDAKTDLDTAHAAALAHWRRHLGRKVSGRAWVKIAENAEYCWARAKRDVVIEPMGTVVTKGEWTLFYYFTDADDVPRATVVNVHGMMAVPLTDQEDSNYTYHS